MTRWNKWAVLFVFALLAACTSDVSTPSTIATDSANVPTMRPVTRIVPPTATLLPMTTAVGTIAVIPTNVPGTATRTPSQTRRPPTNTSVSPTATIRVIATANPAATSVGVVGVTQEAGGLTRFAFGQGSGAARGFWQVYFTAPTGSRNAATYVNGIDTALANAIGQTTRTLDIAAYEFNNAVLTTAVLDAARRGVRVRVVTDNEGGFGDDEGTLEQLENAGIAVVSDTRSALMHDKFMILDSLTVWTGSWNYTVNDTYRNNNNALVMRARRAVEVYQAEFDEMFTNRRFGPTSPVSTDHAFTQNGVPVEVYFAPEDDVLERIVEAIGDAESTIHFMAFSFTEDSIAAALLERVQVGGVTVQGVFERTGSQTDASEMDVLFCGGADVRQDGNPFVLHHKVFIIDSRLVVTGSFNFSANATRSNDENLVLIEDPALAAEYEREYARRWEQGTAPTGIDC